MAMPRVRLDTWTDEQAKSIMLRRYREAKAAAQPWVEQGERNMETCYRSQPTTASSGSTVGPHGPIRAAVSASTASPTDPSTGINLALKNVRLLHSQLSANPPTCVPRPSTSDQEDRRAAKGADRVIRHSLRAYGLQEKVDMVTLPTLIRGIGILKVWQNPAKGEILRVSRDGRHLLLQGDIDTKTVSQKHWFPDPKAKSDDAVRYCFEEVELTREEFLVLFPQHRNCLRRRHSGYGAALNPIEEFDPSQTLNSTASGSLDGGGAPDAESEAITVVEYWESGLPTNGYAGRFGVMLDDGYLLQAPVNSPHSFRPRLTLADIEARRDKGRLPRKPPKARLPYIWLTDIDVPDTIWGKSAVEFAEPLQDLANRLASTTLMNLQAHSVMRVLVEDGAQITKSSWSNDPFVTVGFTRKNPTVAAPTFMQPGRLPAEHAQLQQYAERGVSDMFGTNESMFGVQSREQSGYSMSYAVNQANLIRRRLFNKYVLFVEALYQTILDLAIKHWKAPRTIQVLGREKAYELESLRGADIVGGYSLVVEYGTSLSLDPATRRDEILRLRDVLKSGGVSDRTILGMMRLGELDSLADAVELSDDRAREVVEFIAENELQVLPMFAEDHEGMLAYLLFYVMTREFRDLTGKAQDLVREHVRLRFQQMNKDKAEMAGAPPAAVGGGAPAPGQGAPPLAGLPAVGPLPTGPASEALPPTAPSMGPGAVPPT